VSSNKGSKFIKSDSLSFDDGSLLLHLVVVCTHVRKQTLEQDLAYIDLELDRLALAGMSMLVSRVPMPGGTHVSMAQIVDLVVDAVDLALEAVSEAQDVAVLGGVGVPDTMECAFH
jgi:hypothetical protein